MWELLFLFIHLSIGFLLAIDAVGLVLHACLVLSSLRFHTGYWFASDSPTCWHRTSMDRLECSASLMIVSDLDFTMVDHDDKENLSLLRFNALWEAYYRHNSLLVFSTGRSLTIYKQLKIEKPLLTPDVTITSVGTEIAYGESMEPDEAWEQYLSQKWNREIVLEETAKFPQLSSQSETEQRPHKVSFFIEKDKAMEVVNALWERLEKRGLDVKVIYSNGIALDVLPKGAGKGEALSYLLRKFKADGKEPGNTLVCGDSGNDAELFPVPNVYGVMVSNAQEELLQWYRDNAKENLNLIHATKRCAAGIIQAIGNFCLGPNVSPRDVKDYLKCKVDISTPAHEVIKFYLFYERWRRAEVDKSDRYLQHLNSFFSSSGIFFIHPSGVERCSKQCIEAMKNIYGDRQGKQFRVWLDRVSTVQISSDTWLVKFDKWESLGIQRQCCLTTVLMSLNSDDKGVDGYEWVHMLQTWLDGSGAGADEDQAASWLF